MNQAIERRIKALERILAPAETNIIIVSFIAPDIPEGTETKMTLSGGDRRWTRFVDESEDDFIERVKAELEPNRFHMLFMSWR